MSQFDSLLASMDQLPPRPWVAFGHTVYSGSTVVAFCAGPDGQQMAAALAKLPDLVDVLSTAYPSLMASRIADLEEALAAMKHRCECE